MNLDKMNLNSEENKKVIEEYIQRMGIKDLLESASNNPNIVNENKMRIYQKILENEGKFENPEDIMNYSENENEDIIEQQQDNVNTNNQNQESLLFNSQKNNTSNNNNNAFLPTNIINTNSSAINYISNNNNNPLIQTSNFDSSNNFVRNSNTNANITSHHNHNSGNYSNSNGNSINNINVNVNSESLNMSRKGGQLNNSKHLSMSPRKIKTNTDTVSTEREKIHMLNIKAMNYRHEVETLKKKINELNKTIEHQKEKIYRVEKQKENDNKYLIKLENMLAAQSTGSQPSINALLNNLANNNNMSSISNLSQKNFTSGIYVELKKCTNLIVKDKANNFSLNLIDQNEMKEFVLNLMNECQKLKAFQRQVFEISKNYDDINENIINSIKTIQNIMEISSVKSFDENQKKEIYGKK